MAEMLISLSFIRVSVTLERLAILKSPREHGKVFPTGMLPVKQGLSDNYDQINTNHCEGSESLLQSWVLFQTSHLHFFTLCFRMYLWKLMKYALKTALLRQTRLQWLWHLGNCRLYSNLHYVKLNIYVFHKLIS